MRIKKWQTIGYPMLVIFRHLDKLDQNIEVTK